MPAFLTATPTQSPPVDAPETDAELNFMTFLMVASPDEVRELCAMIEARGNLSPACVDLIRLLRVRAENDDKQWGQKCRLV